MLIFAQISQPIKTYLLVVILEVNEFFEHLIPWIFIFIRGTLGCPCIPMNEVNESLVYLIEDTTTYCIILDDKTDENFNYLFCYSILIFWIWYMILIVN